MPDETSTTAQAPQVVVQWLDETGEAGHHSPGMLRVEQSGQGWGVVTPLTETLEAALRSGLTGGATLIIATEDGTTERMPASRIEFLRSPDGVPGLAMLWLPRPIRGRPSPRFAVSGKEATVKPGDTSMWDVLVRASIAHPQTAGLSQQELQRWCGAAQSALHGMPRGETEPKPPPPRVVEYSLDAVAGWMCWFIRGCSEDDSDRADPRGEPPYLLPAGFPFPNAEDASDPLCFCTKADALTSTRP